MLIMYDNKCVGLAFGQEKLYMLPMHENVNFVVCNESSVIFNEKVSLSMNVRYKCKRKDNETSTKLWQYRLGHILWGKVERLIKEDIIHPLIFSNS
jgi:hypothetical protein